MKKNILILILFKSFCLSAQTLRLSSLIVANAPQYSLGNATLVNGCDKNITFTVTNTGSTTINRAIKLYRISTTGSPAPQALVAHVFSLGAGNSLTFHSGITQVGTNQIPASNGLGGTTGSPAGSYDFLLVGNTATTPLASFDLNSITSASPPLWTTSTSFNNPQAVLIQPSGVSTTPTISAASTSVATGNSTTINITSGTLGFGCDWKYSSTTCRNIPNTIISGTSFSSGSITSPTTFYVWGNHCNTNSFSTSLNTLCDNVTVTNIPCTKPATPSTPTAGTPACGQNILTSSSSPPSGVDWYWQTASNGTDMSNKNPTFTVYSNGTYYLRAHQPSNGGCWSDNLSSVSATVLSYSSSPLSISASANPIDYLGSTTLTVNGGTLGSGANWVWYEGTCGSGTQIGTGNSTTRTLIGATTDYCVRAEGTCGNSSNASQTITVNNNNTLGINISNSTMAPWQREGDVYTGSISITSTPNFYPWKVDVLKNGATVIKTYNISTAGTLTTSINSNDFLSSYQSGDIFTYRVSYQDGNSPKMLGTNTNIIDKKWDKPTVLFNSANLNSKLKIPMKWYPGINLSIYKIEFKRISDNTTFIDKNITPNSGDFNFSTDGYAYITRTNSNIINNRPGDFEFIIKNKNNNNVFETDSFEYVKYGNVNYNATSSKALIFIGGWNSDIEAEINNSSMTGNSNDGESFSISKYSDWNNFYKTFYIAQPNANYTQVNAFALGKAIEEIKQNNGITEVHIIAHSKGGLEMRTLLSGLAVSFKDRAKNYINYQLGSTDFANFPSINPLNITKVVFLATPHNAGRFASNNSNNWFNTSPAYKELNLAKKYLFLNFLNNKYLSGFSKLPNNTIFANLTIYSYISSSPYNTNSYLMSFTDGAVNGEDSDTISISGSNLLMKNYSNQNISNVLQMYQHSDKLPNNPLNLPHSQAHVNECLTRTTPNRFSVINQTLTQNNLIKIRNFLILSNSLTPSVPRPTKSSLNAATQGSIISGSKIQFKLKDDTSNTYYPLGVTNSEGRFQGKLIPDFSFWDSMRIEANNMENMIFSLDSNTLKTGKLIIPMMYKDIPDTKVVNPILKVVGEIPLTDTNHIKLYINGTNISNYNYRINSIDSPFKPLTLNSNIANFPLDYGQNKIDIMYCGIDTAYQSKEIWYYPDTAILDETKSIDLTNVGLYKKISLYIDGIFWKTLVKDTTFLVPKFSREIKVIKQGYLDLISPLKDSNTSVSISLTPHNYSSISDSGVLNFKSLHHINYWKNTTLKSLNNQNVTISLKQTDIDSTVLGIKPISRLFHFKNLSNSSNLLFRSAIILDQIDSPEFGKMYLLTKKDSVFYKKLFNIDSSIIYHSDVQKIGFDSIKLTNPLSLFELNLAKKLAPIVVNSSYSMYEDIPKSFSIKHFFADPDSIKNDINFTIDSVNSNVTAQIINDSIRITPNLNFNGSIKLSLSSIHDWIKVSKDFNIQIVPVNDTPVFDSLPQITVCSGHNDSFDFTPYISDVDNTKSQLNLQVNSMTVSLSSVNSSNLIYSIFGHKMYFRNMYRDSNVSYIFNLLVNDGSLNSSNRQFKINSLKTTYSFYKDTICQFDNVFGYKSTGVYYDTLVNHFGCDSVRRLNLYVKKATYFTIYNKFCSNYPRYFNGNYIQKPGRYEDTLINSKGCDSFLSLVLYVDSISNTIIIDTICDGDTVYFKKIKIYNSGLYRDTLKNIGGCDSFITYKVFKAPKKVLFIEQVGDTIVSPQNFKIYSWYFKNNLQPLQFKNIYKVSNNGEYYLKAIDSFRCHYTSNIINYSNSLIENLNLSQFSIYPNPTKGNITIELLNLSYTTYKVINVLGQTVESGKLLKQRNDIQLNTHSKGFYQLELMKDSGEVISKKLIIE